MDERPETTQPIEDMLQADIAVHSQLEQRTRRNWIVLIATSLLSTVGLALAVTPLLRAGVRDSWPWTYTNHALLAGFSLLITVLVWYLTEQERRVTHLRAQLLDARRRELKYCKSYGRAPTLTGSPLAPLSPVWSALLVVHPVDRLRGNPRLWCRSS